MKITESVVHLLQQVSKVRIDHVTLQESFFLGITATNKQSMERLLLGRK